MLTSDIDIVSEKLKLSKTDLQFIPQEIKDHPHLTLQEFAAAHTKRLEGGGGIPYSIIEDDLPRIRQRHFSIVNDPYIISENKLSKTFKICFTVHKFSDREGFCTSYLRDSPIGSKIKVLFSHSNKVIGLNSQEWCLG
jgi:hypothetical protein